LRTQKWRTQINCLNLVPLFHVKVNREAGSASRVITRSTSPQVAVRHSQTNSVSPLA
jgi:hypothetical protein